MAIVHDIVTYPSKTLREKSEECTDIEEAVSIGHHIKITLQIDPIGIGLAAPQIGIHKRILGIKEQNGIKIYINPKIIQSEGMILSEEGCLSIPGFFAKVKRAQKIKVVYIDEAHNAHIEEFEDFMATVLQHEIDHLDGILFPDRLPGIIRRDFVKKIGGEKQKPPVPELLYS